MFWLFKKFAKFATGFNIGGILLLRFLGYSTIPNQ